MISFREYLILQRSSAGLFSRLGAWVATLKNGDFPAKDWPAVFYIEKNYPGHAGEIPSDELAKTALASYEADVKLAPTGAAAEVREVAFASLADLYAHKEKEITFHAWPFLSPGMGTVLDGLPKWAGKTFLVGMMVKAILHEKTFLGHATIRHPIVWVSEQSRGSLGAQLRHPLINIDLKNAPPELIHFICREDWGRVPYAELIASVEQHHLVPMGAKSWIIDTFHTTARLLNDNDSAELNAAQSVTLDVMARHNVALVETRHERKSGGDIGVSGRNSIQFSGLMDIIARLGRPPGKEKPTRRVLELLARITLPESLLIDATEDGYVVLGEGVAGMTASVAEKILRAAPTSRKAAKPISDIFGDGYNNQPVRDAVVELCKRGFLQRTDTTVNGRKRGIYWTEIPPMDLAQVEVIKGVASALYGMSAIGGVVNLGGQFSVQPYIRCPRTVVPNSFKNSGNCCENCARDD